MQRRGGGFQSGDIFFARTLILRLSEQRFRQHTAFFRLVAQIVRLRGLRGELDEGRAVLGADRFPIHRFQLAEGVARRHVLQHRVEGFVIGQIREIVQLGAFALDQIDGRFA